MKSFKLSADKILPLAVGHGSCIASDMIMVEGRSVGFMNREAPDGLGDSGWRFVAGYEPDPYMNDPDNFGIYDCNTIANYDREIILHLDSPEGAAFEREGDTGPFMEVEFVPQK